MPRVLGMEPKVYVPVLAVGGIGAGVWYYRRRQKLLDEALTADTVSVGSSADDGNYDYGSTYLSPPTTGVGSGGYGGTGVAQGTSLGDVLDALRCLPSPTGVISPGCPGAPTTPANPTGGGGGGGPTPNPGPGQPVPPQPQAPANASPTPATAQVASPQPPAGPTPEQIRQAQEAAAAQARAAAQAQAAAQAAANAAAYCAGYPNGSYPNCYKDCGHDECRDHRVWRVHAHCYRDGHRVPMSSEKTGAHC